MAIMHFVSTKIPLPLKDFQLEEINDATTRLYFKLQSVNIESLDISDYNKKYFDSVSKLL